jgi:hypothetical protein
LRFSKVGFEAAEPSTAWQSTLLIADARGQGFRRFRIRTSQRTEGFYARHGFRVVDRIAGHFGPALDQVEMILEV